MGDGGFDVEIGQMDRAKQLFDRQQGHMGAINTYIGSTCSAPGAFKGLMGLLQGHYTDTLSSARTGMTSGAGIAEHCSTKIGQTKATYLDKDRQAYDRFAAKEKAAGRTVAPYKPPAGGGPLGPAKDAYSPPKGYDPTGGLGPNGKYKTIGMGSAAWKAISGMGKDTVTKTASAGLELNDPKNRRSNPNWLDQQRAARYNRHLYDTGGGMDPDGGYRSGDHYSHNRQTTSGFDQGYHRGSRYAADHVPDGTAYSGAADQDGNITQNRRPGSAWATDEATSPVRAGQAVKDLYDEATGTVEAGQGLYDAVQHNQDVDHLAHSQSNTGSRDWAKGDKGGTW